MKKIKRTLFCVFALMTAFSLSACNETAHTHTFSSEWSNDSSGHWHEPTCDDTDLKKDFQSHSFENGVCTVCGYRDPNAQSSQTPPPSGDDPREDETPNENENPREEDIFGGTLTDVTNADELSEIKKDLANCLYRIGAGGGFLYGDLYYCADSAAKGKRSTYLSGIEGDLRSSSNLKIKKTLQGPQTAAREPINLYTRGNLAFEEYKDATYLGSVENAAQNLARTTIDEIWETFSVASEMFQNEVCVRSGKDGARTVLELSGKFEKSTNESDDGLFIEQQITLKFAFRYEKVIGLNYLAEFLTSSENSNAEYFGRNSEATVLVGSYPFDLPQTSGCRTMDEVPSWAKYAPLPGEEIFRKPFREFESEAQKNFWEDIATQTQKKLSGGVGAMFSNTNIRLTQTGNKSAKEMILDFYNGEEARIQKSESGDTLYTDESLSVLLSGEATKTGDSRFSELCEEFRQIIDELMSLLKNYGTDQDYSVMIYLNDNDDVFKITDKASNRETIYVFRDDTGYLTAIKDVKTLEDGTRQETTLLCGDYKVTMPKI